MVRFIKPFLFFILIFCLSCSPYKTVLERKRRENFSWISCKTLCEDPIIEGYINLEYAISLALQNNKKLKEVFEEKNIARGVYLRAISELFPTLATRADYTKLDDPPVICQERAKRDNYSVDINIRQPIFHGGSIWSQSILAKLNRYLADERISSTIQNIIFLVKKAYYDLLLAMELYKVNEQAMISAKTHLEDVKNKFEAGIASNYDILRSKVEITNFNAALIRQQNSIKLSKANLCKVLGISQKSDIMVHDNLVHISYNLPFDEALKIALENRPELMAGELGEAMQRKKLFIAKSRYLPSIDFLYSNRWGKPDPYTSEYCWGDKWMVNLSLNWEIFDFAKRWGDIVKEKAILKQKRYNIKDIRERISLEVQKAIFSLEDSEELIKSQKMDLERAEEGLKLATVGYREGIRKEVEVTDAISSMTTSRTLYYKAIYEHSVSRARLDLALGIPKQKMDER